MIDCYNKKINILNYILLLMEDILNLSHNLNIYVCCHESNKTVDVLKKNHVYKEDNIIIDCLAKK